MTHTFMTSVLDSQIGEQEKTSKVSRSCTSNNLYMVCVEDFDHNPFVSEVEACSYEEANRKATALFGADIYSMSIYLID